jgi:hypothetical protein
MLQMLACPCPRRDLLLFLVLRTLSTSQHTTLQAPLSSNLPSDLVVLLLPPTLLEVEDLLVSFLAECRSSLTFLNRLEGSTDIPKTSRGITINRTEPPQTRTDNRICMDSLLSNSRRRRNKVPFITLALLALTTPVPDLSNLAGMALNLRNKAILSNLRSQWATPFLDNR